MQMFDDGSDPGFSETMYSNSKQCFFPATGNHMKSQQTSFEYPERQNHVCSMFMHYTI